MSLLTEEIAYLREDVKDLQQRLALKDLEIMRLREAFYLNMLRAFPEKSHEEVHDEIDKLYGATTYDDLLAWHEAQLGEPVAWKYKKRDGEPTATLNKDFAFIVRADGFDVTPLYKLKD